MMVVAVAATMLYGLGLYLLRKNRKPWGFFISHHKRVAGSFARLLKIQLQQRGSAFNAFLDTDNLRDLKELFGFVRDTETFVILASPGILGRKWCVGEITTANLHNVRSVMVRWPHFVDPNENMHENLSFAIPGIEALTAYSISLHDVSKALHWMKTLQSIAFPIALDLGSMGKICDALTGTVSPPPERAACPDCAILADPGNHEAVATAHVLSELLKSNKEVRLSPVVLKAAEGIPDDASKALLICSSGCFHSKALASWLIELSTLQLPILPILAEPDFILPTEPYENAVAGVAEMFTDAEMATYADMLGMIFQEIASVLAPQSYASTQEDLELRVKQIAFRLRSKSTWAWTDLVVRRESEPFEDVFRV
ncbi:RPS6 [Symbiodinium natans]|uniref:RPS6 protein n=1 Tax=Symbiodinium natans TaxID=878477 RepID=A0A812I5I1_9DINO|nr:RPS6 [Symbiodinium natans]